MPRTRAIIVIPAAQQVLANAAAKVIDPAGGEKTFTVGMLANTSPNNQTTPDYYICDWQFESGELALLTAELGKAGILTLVKIHELDNPDPALGRPTKTQVMRTEQIKDCPSPISRSR